MNFVTSLKQTKTKTAKQERSIDVQTLSKLFIKWDNKGSYAPSLSIFLLLLNLCNYQQIIKGLI